MTYVSRYGSLRAMSLEQKIQQDIKAALMRHDITPTKFGRDVNGDPCLVPDILAGKRSVTLRTADKIKQYIWKLDGVNQQNGDD